MRPVGATTEWRPHPDGKPPDGARSERSSSTNERGLISTLLPDDDERFEWLLVSNLNSFALDFVARQKLHGETFNWFIVEEFPVVPREGYERRFGSQTAREIVADHVLRLTYSAHNMEPFARDMGYDGEPFRWDETERRHLRARLDAPYFHLYGVTDEDDVRTILSTFPIVERKDREAFGCYLTAELIVWYMRALDAGDPEATAEETVVLRTARERKGQSAA